MYERFTDDARRIMQEANKFAQEMNHEYIGTEHMLVGVCRLPESSAYRLLRYFGLDPNRIQNEVRSQIQVGPEMISMGKLPQTPRAKKVIEYSMEESRNLNNKFVGSAHLVLGLIRETEGVAAEVLVANGVRLEKSREWVMEHYFTPEDDDVEAAVEPSTPESKTDEVITDTPSFELLIDPGSATREEIAELFTEISTLHRMLGGAGINFVVTDCRLPAGEGTCP